MKKILKVLQPVGIALGAIFALLVAPIALGAASVKAPMLAASVKVVDHMLIAYTFAQTAPSTVAEMTTEVTGFANTLMPSWLVYVVFALIAAISIWLIGRAIGAMKRT